MSTKSVEVDIDDIIDQIDTDILENELIRRGKRSTEEFVNQDLKVYIESNTGRILQSMTNEDIICWVLSQLRR